jgi:ketosteroid isomerase-like protein
MSRKNVEAVKRATEASNRRDLEAVVEELDAAVEWYDAAPMMLGGKATVYRGHEGARDLLRELDDVLDEIHVEYTEIRDLDDRVVAIGRIRTRGKGSGAETEAPYGIVFDFDNGKAIRIRTYVGDDALEAAGLRD